MKDISTQLDEAISRGIDYLCHHQFPNGEFCSYIANDAPMLLWTATDSCVFPTALIAGSLLFLQHHPKVDEVLTKSTFFFECQMERGGVWNHFTQRHLLRYICPFDVDDTACVSSVFRARGIDWPLPSNIPVILANRNSSGLFYTWFVARLKPILNRTYWRIVAKELTGPIKSVLFWRSGEATRNDIDAVVNANVLYYIGENKHTEPIINYLLNIIQENREADCDTWYRNPFTVYYFLSRNYFKGTVSLEPARQPIIDRILASAKTDGRLGDCLLDTALAACTLINLHISGKELENAIAFILNNQRPTGEWERWILYWGGPKMLMGWGSEELTTGFCLEAMARFRDTKN